MTVDEALAAAEARNPVVAAARARVDQARGRRTTAGQLVPARPELEIAGATDAPFAGDGEVRIDIAVRQDIELFGQRGLRRRVADADVAAATLAGADELRRLRAETRATYYALMFQERRAALAIEVVDAAQRLEESARRRVAAGDLGESDWQLLVADVAAARAELRAAEADVRVAQAALNRLVVSDAPADIATTEDFPTLADQSDVARLVARAAVERPDLAAADQEITAARAEVALRRRERLPTLTFIAGYVYERGILGGDDVTPPVFDRASDTDHLVSAGVSFPLPFLRSNAGDIAEARGRAAEADARRAGLAARVAEEVAAAWARYDAARARVAALDEASRAVATILERYQRAWTEKHIALAEYLAVRDRLLRVRLSALEARRDGAIAAAELEAAVAASATTTDER